MADDTPILEVDLDVAKEDARRTELVEWVMGHVDKWRLWRNNQFQRRWAEYYRLWRGFYAEEDKTRDSERSRLIAPALQQAIEMTVAEMEEATFGRGVWIDISDDYEDPVKEDAQVLRDQLITDFEYCGVPASVSEAYLNGALYGTGIGKIMYARDKKTGVLKVWLEPVAPQNFVVDPSARNVDEALGCAHEIATPRHKVLDKQERTVYYKTPVGHWDGEFEMFNSKGEAFTRDLDRSEVVYITEYHGLVPRRLLNRDEYKAEDRADVVKDAEGRPIMDDGPLVEAIITIANKGTLLRDVENPYTNKDRAIIAYQHETVPNQFWGRSVSEKGYNPQKALDAELRARIDALGLLTYPVMGADATRLPRGLDLRIRPGKLFLTNGRPSEVLEPIVFGNLNPATFQQSGDLERMVNVGTGAMDSSIPIDANRRNETSSGMSQMQSGFIKRAKRTMQNVERNFLDKLVQKSLWRYMQFEPERYPVDYKFEVHSSMGIMAREFEQQTLAQILQVVSEDSPIFPIVIKGILENGALPNKGAMLAQLDKMQQPDPQREQMQQEVQRLQLENAQLENKKLMAETAKALAEAELARARAEYEGVKADLEDDKIEAMFAQSAIAHQKVKVEKEKVQVQKAQGAADFFNKGEDREVKKEEAKNKKTEKK